MTFSGSIRSWFKTHSKPAAHNHTSTHNTCKPRSREITEDRTDSHSSCSTVTMEQAQGSGTEASNTQGSTIGNTHQHHHKKQTQQQQQQDQQQGSSSQQAQPAAAQKQQLPPNKQSIAELLSQFSDELKTGGEANRYKIKEVIGKGSYGVVCSALDQYTGEKVAIKKITNIFEHVSDATRILREIKLLRLLKHPDVVEIKHICLPPSSRDYKDIYVVFELMETDLHQVIKANDDLTPEHHQFFLYQMLRGLKYIHSAKVYHRDLKPKNILANSDCKLKICDFGLARPAFDNMPTSVFWTDYVATRWYRAPELCGSFFAKYTSAIDMWSVGCMFAEMLLGKPLFPGKNVVHQLELITDLLGTPPPEVIIKVRNEKARRFLSSMKPKPGIPFEEYFPKASAGALAILRRLLAFDPSSRPTAEEALAHPYFKGLHLASREPLAQPVSKLAFLFDRCKLSIGDVRDLIYQEILEYHPHLKGSKILSSFQNPSAVENFKRQFFHLEQNPGMVLDSKSNTPSGLVSSNSIPREIGADAETCCVDPMFLQSQGSAPMQASQAPTAPCAGSHHKPPQLDQEELKLLMCLATNEPDNKSSNSKNKGNPASHSKASGLVATAAKVSAEASHRGSLIGTSGPVPAGSTIPTSAVRASGASKCGVPPAAPTAMTGDNSYKTWGTCMASQL